MEQNIPIYQFNFDEYGDPTKGWDTVAMVDKPAIMSTWIAFSEVEKTDKLKFSVNEERRIVTGPILIPNLPILRKDDNGNPFYVVASEDSCEKLMMKFMRDRKTDHVKATHNAASPTTEGVYFCEMFMVDKARGIKCPDGFDCPDKTVFGSLKFDNTEEWAKVGKDYQGFSIEGWIDLMRTDIKLNNAQIQTIIDSIV